MSIEDDLAMMQLSDSFFPTGLYATSGGLEYLYFEKKLGTPEDISHIVRTSIVQQVAPADCTAISSIYDSIADDNFARILEADWFLFASKPTREVRMASVRSGQQVLRCVSTFSQDEMLGKYSDAVSQDDASGVFPVSLAVCCNALRIGKKRCMTMLLYGHTVGMVGAALRLGAIDHFEGQKIIHDTRPVISQAVSECSSRSLDDMWQFAPQMDIAQMSHEKMDSKMFIT